MSGYTICRAAELAAVGLVYSALFAGCGLLWWSAVRECVDVARKFRRDRRRK